MVKHQCRNYFHGEGARGGCYFEIGASDREGIARLDVGYSCAVVYRKEIPVTWLAELILIAKAHPGGIAGFLDQHKGRVGGESYALKCDPDWTIA